MNAPRLYRLTRTEHYDDLEAAIARRRELFAAGDKSVRLDRRDAFSGTWWPVDFDEAS